MMSASDRNRLESLLRDLETNVSAFRAAVEGDAPIEGNILHRARETRAAAVRALDGVKAIARARDHA